MGKGANQQLLTNSGQGASRSQQSWNQAQDLYGQLDPMLLQEATNPQGYTPAQIAAMNTASQQSLGGSTAGVTGQANLEAARTRNAGGFTGAIRAGSQNAEKQLSQNALGIQAQQANLQQAQKQQALSALQGLYGTDLSTALGYLNSSNSALGTENQGSNNVANNALAWTGLGLNVLGAGAPAGGNV